MIPLVCRPADDVLLLEPAGPVTVAVFERRVCELVARLPADGHVLNLCDDRRHFLTAFAAVVAAGSTNLLPPNRQRATVGDLVARFGDVAIVHDGSVAGLDLPCVAIDVRPAANAPPATPSTPRAADRRPNPLAPPAAPRDALAAISFTSGSTGRPSANEKRWGSLIDGAAVNARAMLGDRVEARGTLSMLATVPPQHMYGLELSVMLPLRTRLTIGTGQPLYPADVVAALQGLPEPRALVTTPAHLRALLASALALPAVERVFSATAPLSRALAADAERGFGAELVEIYGCSEVGSIARRRSAATDAWELFEGLELVPLPSAGGTDASWRVRAPHLPDCPALQDALQRIDERRFRLLGRRSDLINIAGKRGSIADVNQRLLAVPGVIDAIAYQPDDGRLAAIVVAPTLSRIDILAALRAHLDPVFLPRPLLFAERLPRQASSKLLRGDVLALHARLLGERSRA